MNKTLLIIVGVAAVGIVGYMLLKNNKSEEPMTKEGSDEQKVAETSVSTSTTSGVNPPVVTNTPIKGETKTDIAGMPVSSRPKNRISSADFQKMEEAKIRITDEMPLPKEASRAEAGLIKAKRIESLKIFALKNNINYDAYMDVIRRSASSSLSTMNNDSAIASSMSNETESFAFTLNF
jgi:hypothetical protein